MKITFYLVCFANFVTGGHIATGQRNALRSRKLLKYRLEKVYSKRKFSKLIKSMEKYILYVHNL